VDDVLIETKLPHGTLIVPSIKLVLSICVDIAGWHWQVLTGGIFRTGASPMLAMFATVIAEVASRFAQMHVSSIAHVCLSTGICGDLM
jgi:hypothetical protein